MTAALRQDAIAVQGATALKQAVGCRKRAARRYGKSVDCFDKYVNADRSSPVFRHDMLLLSVANPFRLVAHAESVAMQHRLEKEPTRVLVVRFHEILCTLEPQAEGLENAASQGFYASGDLETLAQAMVDEAALQTELAGICRLLKERNVDPRHFKGDGTYMGRQP